MGSQEESAAATAAKTPLIIRSSSWVKAPQSGLLRSVAALGSQVKEGEVLGFIADPFGEKEMSVESAADGIVVGRTNLPLVHEGDGLFHIGRLEGTKVQALSLDPSELSAAYDAGIASEIADEPSIA